MSLSTQISGAELSLSNQGLIRLLKHFGLAVPEVARAGELGCWLRELPHAGLEFEATAALLSQGQIPAQPALPGWALQAESCGCARLEEQYGEDLVYERSASARNQQFELARLDSFAHEHGTDLQRLFAELRQLLGARDWLVYYGRSEGKLYLLACLPWGWSWPEGPWISLPDAPLPPLPRPLSLNMLQRAAREWLESIDPQARENEAWAYEWFETLAGRLLLPSQGFQQRLGYRPGQAASFKLGALGSMATMRQRLRRLSKQIWDTFVVSHERFQGNLQQWQEIYRLFLPTYFELGAMIRSLGAGLEANQTLAGYLSDHLNPATRLHDSLIPLWEQTRDWLDETTNQPKGGVGDHDKADPDRGDEDEPRKLEDLLDQPAFKRAWSLVMGQYGHFAPFGLDLTWPRLQDQPQDLLESLAQDWSSDDFTVGWNRRGLLDAPRWQQLARLIDLRESFLADVLWALHQMRQRLMARAEALVSSGKLSEAQTIWWLTPEELARLDGDASLPPELAAGRRTQYAFWQAAWRELAAGSGSVNEMQGIGLQDGVFRGQVWRLDQPEKRLPPDFSAKTTILVTETIDSGWIPCLEQVSGVVLTSGDALSAQAILLRELSKPAVIGLPAAAGLKTGQWLRLNTETGTVGLLAGPKT